MSSLAYENIRMIIGDTNSTVRQGIKTSLFAQGFRNIGDAARLPVIAESIDRGDIDLVVADVELPDGDLSELIYTVRHHGLGDNPFVVFIAMTGNPTSDVIASIIDSGADDLIAKPISPAILLERVTRLTNNRKRFVVTSDYIGPNRRDSDRPDTEPVPLIEVPNPLQAKATGRSVNELQRQIDATRMLLNEEKMQRHVRQIAYLVRELMPKLAAGGAADDSVVAALDRLKTVSEDISRRMQGTRFAHVGDLCQTMIDLAARVRARPDSPAAKDVKLMPEVADAINAAFAADDSAALAYDISETVRRYAGGEPRR